MASGEYDHEAARAAYWAGAYEGMLRWAEMVLGKAQRDAPIETGALRASGTIEHQSTPSGVRLPDSGGSSLSSRSVASPLLGHSAEVWIIFPLIYAAYQHEGHRADGTYVIQEHPKGGKSKYLEDPVKSDAPLLEVAMAAGARRVLGG